MKKPENTFIDSVHKRFAHPKVPHREKMNNPYSSGTPDVYYSGNLRDAWVEYKYLPTMPVRKPEIIADCTALQLKWLRGRHEEGRMVYVIVGCPLGGVILSDLEWEKPIPLTEFNKRLITRQAIADWLTNLVQGDRDAAGKQTGNLRNSRKAVACDERTSDVRRSVRQR